MRDPEAARHAFAGELAALVSGSPLSSSRVTAAARQHGVGYSTLRSWCTGVHLPRTPEDNAEFRAFLLAVAADAEQAERVLGLAKRAWRYAARVKHRGVAAVAASDGDVESAYLSLGDAARRLVSWLGAGRYRAVTAQAATALSGWSERATGQALAELVAAGLVESRREQRFAVVDGARAVVDGRGDRDAEARLAAHYGRTALAAARRLFPDLLELAPLSGTTPVRFATDEAASAWLVSERDNLITAAETALGHGGALAGSLVDALRAAHQVRPQAADWSPLAESALREADDPARLEYAAGAAWWGAGHPATAARLFASAARRWGAPHQERERASALHMLGAVHHALGDWHSAVLHSTQALRLRRRTGEHRAQASTLVFLADAYTDLGQPDTAVHHARAAADLAARTGYSAGTAGALGSLGRALLAQGLVDDAERSFVEQQALSEDLGFHSRRAIALVGRALVCNHRDHFESAVDLAEEAASVALAAGNVAAEADAYNAAAHAHRGRGRLTQAQVLHRKALHLSERTGYRHGRVTALAGLRGLSGAGQVSRIMTSVTTRHSSGRHPTTAPGEHREATSCPTPHPPPPAPATPQPRDRAG